MYYLEVAPIKLVRQDAEYFTYTHDSLLQKGSIVTVQVGNKTLVGIVIKNVSKPKYQCKPIKSVVIDKPIPEQLIDTAVWISKYYQVHLSSAINLLVPAGIDKNRRAQKAKQYQSIRKKQNHLPTKNQKNAINSIINSPHTTQILHGITGSGKTMVYIECAKKMFSKGLSSIILVPEISLTSQLLDEFRQVFKNDVIVSHSRQTEAQRHQAWLQTIQSKGPKIIIGPRSALFMPITNIGLIVLDEFHEPSYKQDQQPRYSSLRVATVLAKYHNAKAIFGSATPTVSEYYLSEKSNVPIIKLTTTAQKSVKPTVSIIDMTKRTFFTQHRFISDKAIESINHALKNKKQVIVFHNRRGTTAITLCSNCGWSATEPDTGLPLTLHADRHLLVSHLTGYTAPVPTSCPICKHADIVHKGIGTKLIESELRKLYPNKKIARFDGDSKQGDTVDQRYNELYNGEIDIIIGTQVIAKGIDLPNLSTVCIIQADSGLAIPDYSSSERTFQLLAQAIGRVGRNNEQATVVVQTYNPKHPAIVNGISQNYDDFYKFILLDRQKNHFPPFTYLAKFTCIYKTESASIKNCQKLLKLLKVKSAKDVLFFGPAPSFYEKQHNTYRWNIILKSPNRKHLIDLASNLPSTHWQFELDPISLL